MQAELALTVVLEGLAAAMGRPAVGLDDQALGAPEEVDLVGTDPLVDLGPGRRWRRKRARKRRSSSELVRSLGISARSRSRNSAWRIALRTWLGGATRRRSVIVRAGVVTAMRFWCVVAASVSDGERCRRIPALRARPLEDGIVTSTGPPRAGSSAQSAAAERWLSTDPSPQASTAAIHLP